MYPISAQRASLSISLISSEMEVSNMDAPEGSQTQDELTEHDRFPFCHQGVHSLVEVLVRQAG